MRKLLIVSLLYSTSFFAQIYKPIEFPAKVEKKYIIDPVKDEEKYRNKVAKKVPSKYLKSFTTSRAYSKAAMFRGGEIYLSWKSMEDYVNQVLDSIMPTSLASKKIHAFIGRSSAINAYCLYDGTMIVNVGLIAEVKSEAALAAAMGHELAHYMKSHGLNRFVNAINTIKNKKRAANNDEVDLALEIRGYGQKNELEADEIGFGLMRDAKYDLNEAFSNFELFIRENEYYNKRNKSELANTDSVKIKTSKGTISANTLEKLLSSHPDEKERKDRLSAFIKGSPQTKPKLYKIDEDIFTALQKQARLESISILFDEYNYSECLERAFIYHLFEPDNLTLSYYIAECIRRECLFDYTLKKKGFLTYNVENDGIKKENGILQDLHYMVPDEARFKKIKATPLLDKSSYKFKTYREAYYYFAGLLEKKDFTEVYLMNALFENNKTKIKSNIDRYLAKPAALRKEYAKNYLNGTLTNAIEQSAAEIALIPRVNYFRDLNYNPNYGGFMDVTYDYKKSEITGNELAGNIADKITQKKPGVKAISIPREEASNFNSKIKYENIINTTLLASRDENEGITVVHYYKELEDEDYVGKLDLFRLSPDTWQFFYDNKINTISYTRYGSHYYRGMRKMQILYLALAPITGGLTLLYAPFIKAHGRELKLYSFNASMGMVVYNRNYYTRRMTSNRGVKMFNNGKKQIDWYIKEYDKPDSKTVKR